MLPILLLVLLVSLAPVSRAASSGLPLNGTPPAKTWTFRQVARDDELAVPPFRRISRGPDGLLYIGDDIGLWEFDGIQWRRIYLENFTSVTALGTTAEGELVAGGSETLSVLPRESGAHWRSLENDMPAPIKGAGNVWEFVRIGKEWCVRAEPMLYCRDARGYYVVPSESRFGRLFGVGGSIYVREAGKGLSRLSDRKLEPLLHGNLFAHRGLAALVSTRTHPLVAVSNDPPELHLWDDMESEPRRVPLLADEGSLEGWFESAVALSDGTIAVAVENGDVVIFSLGGNEVARFAAQRFGASDGAKWVFSDEEHALWIVWSNAITRLEYPSRVTVFDAHEGIPQSPASIFGFNNRIHAIAGTHVYALSPSATRKAIGFSRVDRTFPAIMGVHLKDDDVMLGTMSGVHWLAADQRMPVLPEFPVMAIESRPGRIDEVNLGLRFGVARLARSGQHWTVRSMRQGLSVDAVAVVEPDLGELWVGSLVGRVIRLRTDGPDGDLATAELDEFGAEDGLPAGSIAPIVIDGRLLFVSVRGFQVFEGGRFVAHPNLPFSETGAVRLLRVLPDNQLVVVDPKGLLRLLKQDITGTYRHQRSVFDTILGVGKIREIHVDDSGIVWLASDSGVIRVDPRLEMSAPMPQQVLVRQVMVGDATLFTGYGNLPTITLPEGTGVRFGYALPSYRAAELNRYRSRIRAQSVEVPWSNWSNETKRDFTNLPAGELVFEVEAMDASGGSGGIAAVPIHVTAPWYRQAWAIAAFWITGLLVVLAGVQWRVRALRARSAELERLVAIKTEALQIAATTDPLTGLWNRHRFGQWVRDEVPKVNAAVAHAAAGDRVDLIACVIDLDHFKRVNDQHGHAAGDAVLKAVAERLQAMRENGDLVFRFGGEEFVYLGINRHRDEGKKLAERIVHEIAQINVELESGVLLDPTASVGWSVYPFYRERADLFSLDFVLGLADRALYLAKQVGRNRAYGYLPNIDVDSIDRTQSDWRAQVFNRHTDFLRRI